MFAAVKSGEAKWVKQWALLDKSKHQGRYVSCTCSMDTHAVLFPVSWDVLVVHSATDVQHGLTANSQCADCKRDLSQKDPVCK
jgi:hypothetical protein